ncbi:MAG: hypothetical protein K5905_12070 [Roseibium sp.]|uniref:hypothetical protein n=1 Tax=Roseibium sp. TaxID=1936156 RepID=UPI00261DBE6D|nr:hypothetical protein [Roseibium sp.]MCV0426203.1 hypothetical protein [Roseibium sp.]
MSVKIASQPGVRRIHAFSGEATGLDLNEARSRITGSDHDIALLMSCFAAYEHGLLQGRALAKDGETENDD